jgi:hypothetical protein
MTTQMGICITEDQQETKDKGLMIAVMQDWLPVADMVLETTVLHFPSAVQAQRYLMQILHMELTDDVCGIRIRECDLDGAADGVRLDDNNCGQHAVQLVLGCFWIRFQ